jgi:hypothetical protein
VGAVLLNLEPCRAELADAIGQVAVGLVVQCCLVSSAAGELI